MTANNQNISILSRLVKAVRGKEKGVDADPDLGPLLEEAEATWTGKEDSTEPYTEKRTLPEGVTRLVLDAGGVNVKLIQGSGRAAMLRGSSKADLDNVSAEVLDGTLTISNRAKVGTVIYSRDGVSITQNIGGPVYVGGIAGGIRIGKHYGQHISGDVVLRGPVNFGPEGMDTPGGAEVQMFSIVEIEIELPSVEFLSIRGAGDIDYADINCNELEVDISGAGTVRLEGKAERLDAEVSGAGNIKGKLLIVQKANLRVSGAGNVSVSATRSVKARVSGAGNVNVYGNPLDIDQRTSGVGSINIH